MSEERTILVVEDYAPSRYAFRRILSGGRFVVREASDAAAARQALGPDIDALLLDVNLPDGNGIELCREVRRRFPDLPVILISASYHASAEKPEWQAAGATAFLEQPVSASELLHTLETVLEGPSSEAAPG